MFKINFYKNGQKDCSIETKNTKVFETIKQAFKNKKIIEFNNGLIDFSKYDWIEWVPLPNQVEIEENKIKQK